LRWVVLLVPEDDRLHAQRDHRQAAFLVHLRWREPGVLPTALPRSRRDAPPLCRLSGRIPWLEPGLVLRLLHLRIRRDHLLYRNVRSLRKEEGRRQQSLGRRGDDAGMDAFVAAAIPSVRNAAAD